VDSLFDEPSSFDRDALAARLKQLAEQNIYIGGSSWKYEGWLGQIYTRSNYLTRGRFSQKLFNDTCLKEYAATFPTVCGDFAFYQFPSEEFWRRLFQQTSGIEAEVALGVGDDPPRRRQEDGDVRERGHRRVAHATPTSRRDRRRRNRVLGCRLEFRDAHATPATG
jgi:hypothetical protein